MSRVSTESAFATARRDITAAREKETTSAEKSSSLKELTRPSQAPAEYIIVSDVKDDVAIREGIAKNATQANHVLNAQDNILGQAQDIVQKIHELALNASSRSIDNQISKHVLPEVEGLFENLHQTLNTRFGNRTLLAGFKNSGKAFDQEGNFLGDNGEIKLEIDRGLTIKTNVSGAQVILGEGLTGGVNILTTIGGLVEGLRNDDVEAIRGSLNGLERATDQISLGRTQIAGHQTEIQRALETNAVNNIQRKESVAQIEEADPIKVFSDLARDQTVLRAAIETSRKILNESPTDILFK